jgi:hypothetical protein
MSMSVRRESDPEDSWPPLARVSANHIGVKRYWIAEDEAKGFFLGAVVPRAVSWVEARGCLRETPHCA